jgi:hypothetical protein
MVPGGSTTRRLTDHAVPDGKDDAGARRADDGLAAASGRWTAWSSLCSALVICPARHRFTFDAMA